MGQSIPLPFPTKGVVRNVLRSEQPPGTTWNALNVLPYDRFDRPRGGQRPGTAKFLSMQFLDVDDNPTPIQGILQQTFATQPTISAGSQLKQDQFGFPAGSTQILHTHDAQWETRHTNTENYFGSLGGTADSTTLLPFPQWQSNSSGTAFVLGQGCSDAAPSAWGSSARYKTNYTPGSNVVLTALVQGNALGFTPSAYISWGLAGAAIGDAVSVELHKDGKTVNVYSGNTLMASATAPDIFPTYTDALSSREISLELRLLGTTCQAAVNGVVIVEATVSAPSGNQFAIGGSYTTNVPVGFNSITLSSGSTSLDTSRRQTVVVIVAGGSVYSGPANSNALVLSGANLINPVGGVSMASGQGICFIADGLGKPKQLDLKTGVMTTFTESAGTAPDDCRIVTVWRDRLILAAPVGSEQNFFMSRLGTYTDWDYGQTDPAAAVAGNASTAGHIGEPITALMPFNDDMMVLGGDHTLWMVRGDPADGGTIDLVSDAIGVYGYNSWSKDPLGTIYFAGPAGLYSISPGGQPVWLSQQSYNQFFTGIDRSQNYVILVWERDRHGLWIFVVRADGVASTHLFYDSRNAGFWPIQYPANHGPLVALVLDSDIPLTRSLVMGGQDGYVRHVLSTSLDDDGGTGSPTAITSALSYGPVQPAGDGDTVVESLDVTLGEKAGSGEPSSVINTSYLVRGGKSAYEVTEGTARRVAGGTFTRGGRQLSRSQRLRGRWLAVDFSNTVIDTYFSVEQVTLIVTDGGRQR